jgi:hypothetical protein
MVVICNNCEAIQEDEDLIYDKETNIEKCSVCEKSGYLMDLPDVKMVCQSCKTRYKKIYRNINYRYQCPICKSYNVLTDED